MTSVFNERKIYLLLIGNICSSIGSGITMFAIPWLLLQHQDGSQIFGYVSFSVTLFLFFVSPVIGVWIDRYSRKKIMLFCEVFGFTIVFVLSVWGYVTGRYASWQLIAIFISGSMYYSLHFPGQFAFVQEIFDEEQYQSLNSVMEIQNQMSTMIAGGIASVLIGKINVTYILWADALTFLVAFAVFYVIPYKKTVVSEEVKLTFFSRIVEGFRYLKTRPLLILFLVSSFMPFIGVMVGNYIYPVYIVKTLHAGPSVYGLSDMIYAIGAMLAGLTIPFLLRRWGTFRTMTVTAGTYTLSILLIAWLPIITLFLSLKIFIGWGNAGTRVARSTYIMKTIPKAIIGRVNSFFTAVGYGFRVTIIGIFAKVVNHVNPSSLLLFMGVLLVFAFVGLASGYPLFKPSVLHPNHQKGEKANL